MPLFRRSLSLRSRAPQSLALAAAVLVAACGGHAASSSSDAALRRDLDAASGGGLALAPRGSQTQVVSALELGGARKASPTAAPARATTGAPAAPQRLAVRAPVAAPRVIERVRYIDRPAPRPEPEPEVAAAAAAPESEAAPAPAPADPAPVAAPSPSTRRMPSTTDVPGGRGRRGRDTWDMGDVIRNAPFPINP